MYMVGYTQYERLDLTNQIGRKLGVSDMQEVIVNALHIQLLF